jgi:hypothetical protein
VVKTRNAKKRKRKKEEKERKEGRGKEKKKRSQKKEFSTFAVAACLSLIRCSSRIQWSFFCSSSSNCSFARRCCSSRAYDKEKKGVRPRKQKKKHIKISLRVSFSLLSLLSLSFFSLSPLSHLSGGAILLFSLFAFRLRELLRDPLLFGSANALFRFDLLRRHETLLSLHQQLLTSPQMLSRFRSRIPTVGGLTCRKIAIPLYCFL